MRKFFNKIKKTCKNFMTGKSGFSLVELIVVIAIMAVMAAVLVPALLGYVEKSRARKDDSAMSEVTNAIQLSLADMDIYDEALQFAVKDNYSCYCDGDASTNTDANKILTKEPGLWLFNDNARLLDETVYKPAGKMRGVTITLKPNGKAEYILKDGIVNKIGDDSTKKGANAGKVLNDCPELYNRLRSTVGDTIKVSSQTYRNSDYTIFISMGTTGGNQADKQDAIQVYGQYNGTNLPEVAPGVPDAGQNGAPSEQPGGPNESVDSGPNVEQLQEKHQFDYYSTFSGAVADANANTIGENANCDKADATAGIYTENGETFVVLLKDTTETSTIALSKDMTINLGGNVLTFNNTGIGIDTVSNNQITITIDGKLTGSKICSQSNGNGKVVAIQCKEGNTINVNGGTYAAISDSDNTYTIVISSNTQNVVNDCTIIATTKTATSVGLIVNTSSQATVKDCNITANSNYWTTNGSSYSSSSMGIYGYAQSTISINNSNVYGNHSGVSSRGVLNVNGGTYEGYGHGGFYIMGNDTTSYIKNATIKQCDRPTDFDVNIGSNLAGFYIGGGNRNTVVYMDNCTIYGSYNSFVLKVGSGYKNLSLYISNSNINTKAKIRLDSDSIYTNALYIGKGNNFTAENTTRPTAVIATDEIYCQ